MRNAFTMISTRTVGWLLGSAFSALGLLHCSAPAVQPLPDTDTPTTKTPSTNDNPSTNSTPPSTGTKTTSPTRSETASTPPAAKVTPTPDGGAAAAGPGPTCQSLTTCCSKLTNSLEQVGCLLAAGKQNELVCAGAVLTFQCSTLTNTQAAAHGPSCTGLTSGALYCGNDGPGGDANTLYRCNGTGVAIASQCANGCTINNGVDDACSTAANGGSSTGSSSGSSSSSGSCDGLSGNYCGTDLVGGDANTLFTCDGTNAKPASTQKCANGCNTTTDGTNDSCSTTAPPSSTGSSSGNNPCADLPDFSYCGGDGISGDSSTLYTCSGSTLTNTQVCANGCTVGASNVSDYCSFTASGDDDDDDNGGASCAGLDDGFYCGTNGPNGDPSTLYSCSGGTISSSQSCDDGCFAGDFGGSDSCN